MYYFIVNPHSRTGHGEEVWKIVEKELIRLKISYSVTLTTCIGHARKEAHDLSLRQEGITIVVIGGDGTINEVLSGIVHFEHLVLGYIPTGSGNDFAKGMNIPQDTIPALHNVLFSENTTLMDVGCIQTQGRTNRFGVSAGIGFDASICHEALSSRLKAFLNKVNLGKLTYFLISLKQLILYTPSKIEVEMDSGRVQSYEQAYFAAIMNQHCEGGGLKLCPAALPDDGILDVCIVSRVNKLKLALLLPTAFWGRHTRIKGVHILRCKSIKIHSETPLPVHRDGESNGNQTDIHIYIEKKGLKVITPVI